MKKIKLIFSVSLLTILAFICTACKKDLSITMSYDNTKISVKVGETVNVKPNITLGKNVKDPYTLEYTSSKTDVATVDQEGNLVAIAPGSTRITVTANDKNKTSVNLQVTVVARKEYRIKYDPVGGELPDDAPKEFLEDDVVTLPTPTKDGYDFVGWFEDGVQVTKVENKHYSLVAHWQLHDYKINYNTDGGDLPENAPKGFAHGQAESVTLPTPTKDNHRFLGWFEGNAQVTELVENRDYDLVAHWARVYNITYDPDGATLPEDAPRTFEDPTGVTLPVLTKTGYEFLGWFENDVKVDALTAKDYNLVAHWQILKFTITYDPADGVLPTDAVREFEYGQKVTLPTPTKDGYIFDGWFENGAKVTVIANRSYNLVAHWKKQTFTITYDPAEGELPADAVREFEYGDNVTLPVPTRNGYEFAGWFENDEQVTEVENKNYDLVAHWNKQTYTITYTGYNEGELPVDAPKTYSIDDLPLNLPILSREGFDFAGWNTGSQTITIITKCENYNLTAVFVNEPNEVVYHIENGHFAEENLATWDLVVDEFFTDFYEYLQATIGLDMDYEAFKGKPGAYEQGGWYNYGISKGKKLFLAEDGVVNKKDNDEHFLNSEKYYDKWINFFNKLNEFVHTINSDQTLYGDAFAADMRFYQLFNKHSNFYGDSSLLSKHAGHTIDAYEELRLLVFAEIVPPTEYSSDNVITFPDAVNNYGLEFLGWYTSPDFEEETKVENSESFRAGRVHLYAKWEPETKVESITVENEITQIELYKTHQFVWKISPDGATIKDVEFSSDTPGVLSVTKDGLLTAIKLGRAKITLKVIANPELNKTYEIEVVSPDNIDVTFTDEYNGVLSVQETVQLIVKLAGTFVGKNVTYTADDSGVLKVNESGLVTALKEGYGTITVALSDDSSKNVTIGVYVKGAESSERVDKLLALLAEANRAKVDTFTAELISGGDIAIVYSGVNLYLFDELHTTQIDKTPTYYGGTRESIEFITVHDTASPASRYNNASYLATGGASSIHYVVGDYAVNSVVDEKYMAWHAGDGSGAFEWLNTGVKQSDKSKPTFGVIDGYFSVNGTKTSIIVPTKGKRSNGSDAVIENVSEKYFTSLGPVWKVGDDGTVYMGNTWACFTQVWEGAVSSRGGNTRSIGIETCVNLKDNSGKAANLFDTWQRTAKLCADILVRYNLDVSRVQQHNTFSGKDCPHAMRKVGYWDKFIEMIEVEKAIKSEYKDAEITMVSHNPEIVDNTGQVVKIPTTTTTVSYTITVKIGQTSKSITLSSVIPGLCTWYNVN